MTLEISVVYQCAEFLFNLLVKLFVDNQHFGIVFISDFPCGQGKKGAFPILSCHEACSTDCYGAFDANVGGG